MQGIVEEAVQFHISILLISKNAAEQWIAFMEFSEHARRPSRIIALYFSLYDTSNLSRSVLNWLSNNEAALISLYVPSSPSNVIIFPFMLVSVILLLHSANFLLVLVEYWNVFEFPLPLNYQNWQRHATKQLYYTPLFLWVSLKKKSTAFHANSLCFVTNFVDFYTKVLSDS
jgi:hypothetical protein